MHPIGYELCTITDGKGDGVFATRCFVVGETVMVGVIARRVAANDSHATQVSRTEWVRHGGLGPKVNHSCTPNCGVRLNDAGAYDFVAREPIAAGEEITFDYAMRNYSIEHFPSRCLCGSDTCRGSITGWKDLPDERKAAYRELVAPYLLQIDRETSSSSRISVSRHAVGDHAEPGCERFFRPRPVEAARRTYRAPLFQERGHAVRASLLRQSAVLLSPPRGLPDRLRTRRGRRGRRRPRNA